ncbi:hypothetical protein GCM10020331_087200 [Ectobacillus funiculus]
MLEHFKFLKEAVDQYGDGSQVAKFSIPSPNMLFTRIQGDEYYSGNQEEFYNDTVAAYQKKQFRLSMMQAAVIYN